MADDGDKNRKRRRVDKKDSNDDGVIDLTASKSNSFKIHDVVDLTAPVAPKPVQSSLQSLGGFRPKTFGDCDIVSTKDDKLFDDDIVIVVSDAYREKRRQERKNKTPNRIPIAPGSDPNLPSSSNSSAGWINSSAPGSTPSLPTPNIPQLTPLTRPAPPISTPFTAPPISTPSTASATSSSLPQSAASSSNLASLTVSSVISAVTGALATLSNPSPPPSGPTPSGSAGITTASNAGENNAVVNTVDTAENVLWVRFRRHDQRKEFMCPCSRCRCRNWWLTYNTVKNHCETSGCVRGWVPANSPTAPNSEFGALAIAAGGQVNSPGIRAPAAAGAPPAPPPAPARAAPPQNPGPVITDNRPNRAIYPGHQFRGPYQNVQRHPDPRHRLATLQAAVPPPAVPPPAPAGPSLANLPVTVPNVVDNDPNPLTCPVCLDSKAQIQASSRTLVSTTCGHVFCSYCIEQVFKSTRQCPQCRKKLTNRGWHPLYI